MCVYLFIHVCVCAHMHAHLCLNSPEVDIQCVSQSLTAFLTSSLLVMEHTKFVDFISGGEVLSWASFSSWPVIQIVVIKAHTDSKMARNFN